MGSTAIISLTNKQRESDGKGVIKNAAIAFCIKRWGESNAKDW